MQQNIHKLKSTVPTQIDQDAVMIWENELESYNEYEMCKHCSALFTNITRDNKTV